MANLRERMRELREEKGLTQQGLARALNIGKSAIALYETEKRQPDPCTLQKFADFFDVSVDYLLGRSDTRNPDKEIIQPYYIIELAERIGSLPEKDQRVFETILGYMESKNKKEDAATGE